MECGRSRGGDVIAVTESEGYVEVECGHCGTRESADARKDIAGFVLSRDGSVGVHCCWCGRDDAGLLDGSGDELQGGA